MWHPSETVEAVAFDTPVVGWKGRRVNPLRLWSARAVDPLRLDVFNAGDHVAALTEQARAETISKILYPSDETPAGQELRLRQEYFFVSASLQNLVSRHRRIFGDIRSLPDRAAIQLNDTHPAIAVAELMRILVDMLGIDWDEAWEITFRTLSYTNHTLLPEALETWPVPLFERMLPRHMQIIFQINARHLEDAEEARHAGGRVRPAVADRRARRPPRAHGAACLHRLAQDQRRLGAAYRADAPHRLQGPEHGLSRPHRQQDQRHHLPPLAAPGEPTPDGSHRRSLRRRKFSTTRPA